MEIQFIDIQINDQVFEGSFDVEYTVHKAEPDVGFMYDYVEYDPTSPITGIITDLDGNTLMEFKTSHGQIIFNKLLEKLDYFINEQCKEDAGI